MLLARSLVVIATAAALAGAARTPPARAQRRPDCTEVLHQLHRTGGRDGAATLDAAKIAARLGTDSDWVERCAASYGRRIKPRGRKPTEGDEGLSAKAEWREYEDTAVEEREEQENAVQGDPDDGKVIDKARGIDPDSSAEWEPYITHEWEPYVTHEWSPYLHDDDDPGFE